MPEEGRIDPLSVTVTPSMDGNGFKQGENYTFRHYKNSLYETLNSNGHTRFECIATLLCKLPSAHMLAPVPASRRSWAAEEPRGTREVISREP